MIALMLISLALLLAGIAGAIALMMRSGETRVALLVAFFTLLGARQSVAIWLGWGAPAGGNASAVAELAVLAASGAGLWVLVALWRTVDERDRAESLHWESMEAVRRLGELTSQTDVDVDEKFAELLRIGCQCFDLEVGILSRIHKQRFEVIAISAPDSYPVSRGTVFLLADTHCGLTVESDRPVALENVADAARPGSASRTAFGFGCYLGSAVRVFDEVVGTVSFGSPRARNRRFTGTDKDLLLMMSQWIGRELERRFMAEEREGRGAAAGRGAAPDRMRWRRGHVPRSVDVNAAVRRVERRLRALAGPGIEVDTRLADDLQPAAMLRVGVGALVLGLAAAAVRATEGSGRLLVTTENLEVAAGDPDLVPAVAPDRYVTLAVEIADAGIQADRFATAFEGGPAAVPPKGADGDEPMPLASIYRLLQRSGGDLSLEVEAGVGARFTIFLPREGTRAGAVPPFAASEPVRAPA